MSVSYIFRYRDTVRSAKDLEIPARPVIEAAQVTEHHGERNSSLSSPSSYVYRICLGNLTTTGRSAAAAASSTTAAVAVQLEVFSCVQKLNSREISRWKPIALVDLRKRKKGKCSALESSLDCSLEGAGGGNADALVAIRKSVKIAGFYGGYRYLVVVRSIDAEGKRSLYSRPTVILPPFSSQPN